MRVADHYIIRYEREEEISKLMESHNQKAIGKYYPLFRNTCIIHNIGRTKTQEYVLKF